MQRDRDGEIAQRADECRWSPVRAEVRRAYVRVPCRAMICSAVSVWSMSMSKGSRLHLSIVMREREHMYMYTWCMCTRDVLFSHGVVVML